jgi:hypothetical protein
MTGVRRLFITPSQAAQICDAAFDGRRNPTCPIHRREREPVPDPGWSSRVQNGHQVESELRDARPQDVALLLELELIRLNSQRMFELNITVDPSRRNGRLVNWAISKNVSRECPF